jgi:hypothetical protein
LQNSPKLRKFIRHPTDVPIQVTLDWMSDDITLQPFDKLNNVSLGGLAFVSPEPMPEGKTVKVCFPLLDQNRSLTGQVVWNKKLKKGFEIGLQFDDPDELYRLRMIEQICHIEHYRAEIKQREGRQLNSEEAAKEWIKRYAGEFPTLNKSND